MIEIIDSFTGENYFLSNFYPVEVVYNGKLYPSSEHAYQAAKAVNDSDAELIRNAATPGESKKLGRVVKYRDDWDQVKDYAMECILRNKFSNPDLEKMLLNTGDKYLIEGNYWNDTYWGICRGTGENRLGKLLMKIRNELVLQRNNIYP